MKEKIIGGVSLSDWKKAFANTVAIAIDKDYFSDFLFDDLEFNSNTEEDINYAWKSVEEAFEEIFDLKLRSC
jgi:hypothetical protein